MIAKFAADLSSITWTVTHNLKKGFIRSLIYESSANKLYAGGNFYDNSTFNYLHFMSLSTSGTLDVG